MQVVDGGGHREDHSVKDGGLVERRKQSPPDPVEQLSQPAERGQGGRGGCRERKPSAMGNPPSSSTLSPLPATEALPPGHRQDFQSISGCFMLLVPPPLPSNKEFPFL